MLTASTVAPGKRESLTFGTTTDPASSWRDRAHGRAVEVVEGEAGGRLARFEHAADDSQGLPVLLGAADPLVRGRGAYRRS